MLMTDEDIVEQNKKLLSRGYRFVRDGIDSDHYTLVPLEWRLRETIAIGKSKMSDLLRRMEGDGF